MSDIVYIPLKTDLLQQAEAACDFDASKPHADPYFLDPYFLAIVPAEHAGILAMPALEPKGRKLPQILFSSTTPADRTGAIAFGILGLTATASS